MSNGHIDPNSPIYGSRPKHLDLTPLGYFTPAQRPPADFGLSSVFAAIDAKAQSLQAPLPGEPIGPYERIVGGYRRRYEKCTIYFSPNTGAHEVHGEIEQKYDALGGPASTLGFPITDETPVGDGVGWHSDFENGSIYWTGQTGPMMLKTEIRDRWLQLGGPNAILDGRRSGYPVRDQHHQAPLTGYGVRSGHSRFGGDVIIQGSALDSVGDVLAASDPGISWATFENGMIVQSKYGIEPALAAAMTDVELRMVVRRQVDEALHESPDNVGLHAPCEITSVSGWRRGFWTARPREIAFLLHGFRDNGLAPDTNFDLRLNLEFKFVWDQSSLLPPAAKTLVAELVGPFRHVSWDPGRDMLLMMLPGGLPSEVIVGVNKGIHRAFFPDATQRAAHPEVPPGSAFVRNVPVDFPILSEREVDVLDVLTTADGSLLAFVNPMPTTPIHYGILRRNLVRELIEDFVNSDQ